MKHLRYLFLALTACLMTGCMDGDDGLFNDDWKTPETNPGEHFGNNSLQETNVITIKQLKDKYIGLSNSVQNFSKEISEECQIKAVVTANDVGGNVYSEVAVDDGTGAILICISQGGLFAYLPVGQEILVDLKGLCIGCYGYQPQIGTAYTNASGKTFPSRMNPILWEQHFKLIGSPDASKVTAEVFDTDKIGTSAYLYENCAKLMTLKNVKLKEADGYKTFAPNSEKDAGNAVSRQITGFSSNKIVLRSSYYADFAGKPMPKGALNITGVFTRYGTTWQILLRDENDIEEINAQ